ncbi:MAG: Rrf2 family transcriptional regulator [Phycisphaerae bacterium]|nr:Rrf2 family transcriptional regulator [Phycisphaerae bacterium]NIR66858.1 Rrf2 family transcriptional regulator [candidate division Zixibacteria bacterium]NIP51276.1 Rrf2 family transcriptional regulator [Phycisphaerae bacterium]NIS54013.1 Rrf2 family transcriptional regulator [Phycisphaerae bacterium]NIU11621.1 Rrf2 family transcriptional regulator [Phycisphaerae bacterium]
MKVSQATAYALHAMMYMVRHITQLPATTVTIAKAEGIPAGYLAKIFRRLVKAGIVKSVRGQKRGYVFAKTPQEISLLELFEVVEGEPLFEDCLLRHCDCGGTAENCCIFAHWINATRKISQLLEETSLSDAAWDHPEHRFRTLPDSLQAPKKKVDEEFDRSKTEVI